MSGGGGPHDGPGRDGRRSGSGLGRGCAPGGGIVALPTDTVYGIAVSLATPDGIERLFHVKRRPPDKAVMLLLDDTPQAARAATITPSAAALMAACWPGGLTVVVPQRPDVRWPAALTGGSPTIGLRVPAHDAPRTLARGVGPLPTTSANVSGAPEAADAPGIMVQLGDGIDLVLDGGPARGRTGLDDRRLHRATSPRSCGSVRSPRNRSPRSSPPPASSSPAPERRRSWEDSHRACRRARGPSRWGRTSGRKESAAMTISETRGLALESIADVDPVLWEAMQGERRRQHDNIELIASENYVSAAVMEAQGSWLTNKYAEGPAGQALLRWLRVRRHRGNAGPGARAGPVSRGGARQRPAPFGCPGQHGRLFQRPPAG